MIKDSLLFGSKNKEYRLIVPKHESVFDYIEVIKAKDGKVMAYQLKENIAYLSKRYNKYILCDKGDYSDGATGAIDIDSFGWVLHDQLCVTGKFEDNSICTNWQASKVLSDILKEEGRWFRARTWFWSTWFLGGGKARKNGMF